MVVVGRIPLLSRCVRRMLSSQAQYLNEECILVDKRDKVLGKATKGECHQWSEIEKGGSLHRAFSVFLFDKRSRLLLQKRSAEKITFPGMWTNTCCSHPLFNEREMDESKGAIGVRRAAQRKLSHELGLGAEQIALVDMDWLTRIIYKAPSDNELGEHELDYIILTRSDARPKPNPAEVAEIKFVDQKQLREMLVQSNKDNRVMFSPWFKLIAEKWLFKWWNNLENLNLEKDWKTIHDLS